MKKILTAVLLCAAATTSALAQPVNQVYGAIDIGTLTMRNTSFASPGSLTFSLGYRMSRNLAFEGGVTAIGESTRRGSGTSETASQGDVRFLALGIAPVSPDVDLFAKAGLGLHTARITNNVTGGYNQYTTANLILGFGGQLNFNGKFGVRLQFEHLGKSKANEFDTGADISRVSIGGVLAF